MKSIEKRIAIAHATGQWKDCRIIPGGPHGFDMPVGKPLLIDGTFADKEEVVDNYPTDLNAMHEAEKVLNIDQKLEYVEILRSIKGPVSRDHLPVTWIYAHLATAAQRAEAFLRTLNLWKP